MNFKHEIRKLLWKLGYDISRFRPESNSLARRKKLLESYAIDVVIDVGANKGDFALEMRKDLGFSGKIISFEPLSSAFEILRQRALNDPKWKVINCALGEDNSKMQINISGNSDSSSLLNILPAHIKAAPESVYVGSELIQVKRLDSTIFDFCSKHDKIYLKIDTQGYESKVIKGAAGCLSYVHTIQLEIPLAHLYEGELSFGDMNSFLNEKGYSLVSIESGFTDRTSGQLLQVDGIYHRF